MKTFIAILTAICLTFGTSAYAAKVPVNKDKRHVMMTKKKKVKKHKKNKKMSRGGKRSNCLSPGKK